MHWLDLFLQVPAPIQNPANGPEILPHFVPLAPLLSTIAAIANLGLAIYVFSYTRQKNNTDTTIKWFLELVYTPNKEAFASYFKNLHKLKERIPPDGVWTEQSRIDLMTAIKSEKSVFEQEFVNMLQVIAPITYKKVSSSVEKVTDILIRAVDNDELRLENTKTFTREFANPIFNAKNEIVSSIFEYKG